LPEVIDLQGDGYSILIQGADFDYISKIVSGITTDINEISVNVTLIENGVDGLINNYTIIVIPFSDSS
jgi:hypothetical protein